MNTKFKGIYDNSKSVYITNTTSGRGYGKTKQVIDDLTKQNTELKDNWNKLKEWLKEQDIFITELPAFTKEISIEHKIMSNCYEDTLDKMQEIEVGMNE